MDCKIDNNKLKMSAHQKPSTVKPSKKASASNIITAFITSKNKPNVKIVIGKVKKTNIGLTINRSSAITIATTIADK